MANVQKEHGFTAIANEIIENIFLFPFTRLDIAIIFLILRFTYGYQRKNSGISLTQFEKFTNQNKSNISRALQKLKKANVIKIIAPAKGMSPRIIAFNKNYEEWDRSKLNIVREEIIIEAAADKSTLIISENGIIVSTEQGLSGTQPPELSTIQPLQLSAQQPKELSREQHKELSREEPINKEENKMKENDNDNHNLIFYMVNNKAIEKANDPKAAAEEATKNALKDLDRRLVSLYISCFSYHPNIYELEAIKKEIMEDDRLTKFEILKIVQDSFHKVATYDTKKRNTNYIAGVIKNMKQELYAKKEKRKKEEEKSAMLNISHNEEYIPGTIYGAYLENMEKGIKEEKEKLKGKKTDCT
ncbi:MAG: replication protein [Bacteroidota bacterium]|nr:replication protein [Bacteroidota bacterium]